MTAQGVINRYIGKPVEVEDASALDQCMDWAFRFLDDIGVPHASIRNALAYQVYDNYDKKYLTKVTTPKLGDLIIWGTDVGFAGHIAVFESGTKSNFVSVDQNWENYQKVRRVKHNSFGVRGFLRPKVLQSNGGITMAEKKIIQDYQEQFRYYLMQARLGRIPTDKEIRQGRGKTMQQQEAEIKKSGEYGRFRKATGRSSAILKKSELIALKGR